MVSWRQGNKPKPLEGLNDFVPNLATELWTVAYKACMSGMDHLGTPP